MNEKDNLKKEIVFTKAGVMVPVRVDNPLQGVTWESKLIPYSEIKKLGTLTLKVECIQPDIKNEILIALKIQGEFERKIEIPNNIRSVAHNNELQGESLPTLLNIDLTNKFPRCLFTPDGKKLNVTSWASLLVELTNYLEFNNKINDNNIPILDYSRRKRYLVSNENRHLSGTQFIGKHVTKKGLYVETNYPSNLTVKNAIYLIEYCNEDPLQFRIIL
ncbi:MAG: hypothetical protein C3F06_04630 [Candidatus Methanoperedenaceae archaeon]|nr:MAG: hypothetical protein C3F06_04630 [Candidatus Methanoperedenaceae archaeon]